MSNSDSGWPVGYDRIILNEVDSTLDEARRRFADLTGPTWILAHRQTAARGRRGRSWSNPTGNFAATLVLPQQSDPAQAALRSFVAALALYDAVVALTGRADPLALKWPNDVLLNGGKLAGILLETISQQQILAGLSIGIGVNLVSAPSADQVEPGAVPPVSLAGETGAVVTSEDFLTALATAYGRHETQFLTYGFAPIREAWLARATRLGGVITARLPNEEIIGVFETIDPAGHLVLQTPKGRRALAAADIYF